jgi:hypothetical protein
MENRLSGMSIKNWVEAMGGLLIGCGLICFIIGIVVNYFKDPTQANDYSALISFWKKGFLLEICGILMVFFSMVFSSSGQK